MDKHEKLLKKAIAAEEAGHPLLAEELFRECVGAEPTYSRGWLRLASCLMDQKKWTEAIPAAERLLEDPKGRAIALSTIGRCYMGQESWKRAETALRKSLALEEKVTTWMFLGSTLSELDREDEAIEAYQAALKLEPEYDEAHFNLGYSYCFKRDYDRAIPHFRRAIAADPNYAIAYAELGFALSRPDTDAENLREARQVLEKSVALDPAYGWSRIYLAAVLESLNEMDAAGVHYKAAVDIWPASSLAQKFYGQYLAENTDDRVRAKAHLKKAIAIDPENVTALFHLGKNLLRWKRKKDGLAYLRKAAALGHRQAKNILDVYGPVAPKDQRRRSCPKCGAPMIERATWWCDGCGNDLRAMKAPKKLQRP